MAQPAITPGTPVKHRASAVLKPDAAAAGAKWMRMVMMIPWNLTSAALPPPHPPLHHIPPA
jgi:hypothetical protein